MAGPWHLAAPDANPVLRRSTLCFLPDSTLASLRRGHFQGDRVLPGLTAAPASAGGTLVGAT